MTLINILFGITLALVLCQLGMSIYKMWRDW